MGRRGGVRRRTGEIPPGGRWNRALQLLLQAIPYDLPNDGQSKSPEDRSHIIGAVVRYEPGKEPAWYRHLRRGPPTG